METLKVLNKCLPVYRCGALVIGTGCAGYNAADWLYDMGYEDVLMVTEGTYMGTSRNTGSDKQTYYKLALQSGEPDSVTDMAKALAAGISVNGDTAYVEAVNSMRSFMKLVNLNVPFPTNEFGEFVGYQTDHTTTKRATSCGPLTSKFMTEALQKQVEKKNIPVVDDTIIVEILKNENGVVGAVGLNTKDNAGPNKGFCLFVTSNIIAATGGPAAVYSNSVYPPSQTGMTGMFIDAGARCVNLQEWQYGIASVDFRWNLSGTYQQVLPKYVSIDENGVEREFLRDYFETPEEFLDLVFLKGYQWPFDCAKIDGSSLIDLLVYHEEVELGRKVYMDFRVDPTGLENGFDKLSKETYDYLANSEALMSLPIKRLEKMNPAAIELYRSHGIDLYTELLRITVAAQHNNGGAAVDVNWQTDIPGLYVVGEAAGTFGVYRPGGSALNSTQVGSLRAAEHIRYAGRKETASDEAVVAAITVAKAYLEDGSTCPCAADLLKQAQSMNWDMSCCGAHIRDVKPLADLKVKAEGILEKMAACAASVPVELLGAWLKARDMLVTQIAMADSMILAGTEIGSRGGAAFSKMPLEFASTADLRKIFKGRNEAFDNKLLYYKKGEPCRFEDARPMPESKDWFETAWAKYKERRSI